MSARSISNFSWMRAGALTTALLSAGCANGEADGTGDETGTDADTDEETGDGDGDGDDPTDALFDPDHIVEVDIELSEADWDELRNQTRDFFDVLGGEDCLDEPFVSPFTYFPASVTVDGVTLDEIGVRKKGFLGSLDHEKPGLKLKFHEYVLDQTAHGVKRMTLNNSKQDPAFVRQCLVYQMFSDAGIVAPRCNYAHVSVNGNDLGVYVNVEPVKKPFLARHFDDNDGNLYEGTISDFRDGWLATFDKKTNELDPDRSDIDRVVTALDGPDDGLKERVEKEVDYEQFIDFWATEVLVAHWDGYAGNTNNFFVYREPAQDRFVFMPWGADGVLGAEHTGEPHSVMATGALAHRFYGIEATRNDYRDRLQAIMDQIWDEQAIVAEIDRMEQLISPIADDTFVDDLPAAIEGVRDFVNQRRAQIQPELDGAAPTWEEPLRDTICFVPSGHLEVDFATTWNNLDPPDPFNTGQATIVGDFYGQPLDIVQAGAQSGIDVGEEGASAQVRTVALLGNGDYAVVVVNMPPELFEPATYPLEFDYVSGAAILIDPDAGEEGWEFVGNILGTFTLDEASQQDGAPVTGSFSGDIFSWG